MISVGKRGNDGILEGGSRGDTSVRLKRNATGPRAGVKRPQPAGPSRFLAPGTGSLLIIGAMLLFMAIPGVADPVQGSSGTRIEWGPWITNTTAFSATIHWKTNVPGVGRVEYAPIRNGTPQEPYLTVPESNPAILHRVTLQGLDPGTLYVYRPAGDPGLYHFRTFPRDGPVRFIVYGDTRGQEGWKNQDILRQNVADAIAREKDILFVVHTGDLVYDPENTTDWQGFFEMSGGFLGNTTFCPVAGNHEELSEYLGIFGMPAWYSFSCGDTRMIVLNSNPMSAANEKAQEEWLEGELASPPGWTFVALHHPLYSSEAAHYGGRPDLRGSFEIPFIRAGVAAVFSAHVHAYEHYERGGVHYFTVGTGGAPFYPLSPEKPEGYVASLENTVGYAVVTVDKNTAMVNFVPVAEERDGVVNIFPAGSVGETVIIRKGPDARLRELFLPFSPGAAGKLAIPFLHPGK
jgi:hypothetical protein